MRCPNCEDTDMTRTGSDTHTCPECGYSEQR